MGQEDGPIEEIISPDSYVKLLKLCRVESGQCCVLLKALLLAQHLGTLKFTTGLNFQYKL